MDIYRRNIRRTARALIGLFITLMIIGCGSKKKVAENTVSESIQTVERVETVTIKEPYLIEAKEKLTVDSIGRIAPVKITIRQDDVVGEITLVNNEISYKLEKKDTTFVSREIKEVKSIDTKTETNTVVEVKKTFFQRIKSFSNNIIIFIVILVILYILYKVFRKSLLPL